jgi:ubiquinone/menaquinone biosynthesis C-methylase UbiE
LRNKDYYLNPAWDLLGWVDIIAVEYEQLVAAFPFADRFARFATPVRVLDIGCGSGIFPSFLDTKLPPDITIQCDLLDISPVSLEVASSTLSTLQRYEVTSLIEAAIEDIPEWFPDEHTPYDVIWAIHSLTTVDQTRMAAVLSRLVRMLSPNGSLLIYQLTSQSSYQKLHTQYLEEHPNGKNARAFMEFEKTAEQLDLQGVPYTVQPFEFDHVLTDDQPILLESYLRKCILDDQVDVLDFYSDVLVDFHDRAESCYRFPQTVNFIEASPI